jgi:hypothetical protein
LKPHSILVLQIVHNNIHSSTNEGKQMHKTSNSSSIKIAVIHPLLSLQQTMGNQVVERLIRSGTIQTKLRVSNPSDAYEQEADRVAEQVMRMSLQEEEVLSIPSINEEKVNRKCKSCQDEEEMIHRKTIDNNEYQMSGDILQSIESMDGGGLPLGSSTRAFMEPRFGTDLSNVRIHTDTRAAESARALNALAYTIGNDIVFSTSQYEPETYNGMQLLAHELTHVLQQNSQSPYNNQSNSSLKINKPNLETETTVKKHLQSTPTNATQQQTEKIYRQNDDSVSLGDIPAPPPAFPNVYSWFWGVSDKMGELWGMSCEDKLERGFIVMWNEKSGKVFNEEVLIGTHDLVWFQKPPDRAPIYPIGFFHTHTPVTAGFTRIVGPSETDKNTAKYFQLPGIVYDFLDCSAQDCSDCRYKHAGYYFFGPMIRNPYDTGDISSGG